MNTICYVILFFRPKKGERAHPLFGSIPNNINVTEYSYINALNRLLQAANSKYLLYNFNT